MNFQIYNSRGQFVREFYEGNKETGHYSLVWNGTDSNGSNCPTGLYLIRMNAGKDSFSRKVVLVK